MRKNNANSPGRAAQRYKTRKPHAYRAVRHGSPTYSEAVGRRSAEGPGRRRAVFPQKRQQGYTMGLFCVARVLSAQAQVRHARRAVANVNAAVGWNCGASSQQSSQSCPPKERHTARSTMVVVSKTQTRRRYAWRLSQNGGEGGKGRCQTPSRTATSSRQTNISPALPEQRKYMGRRQAGCAKIPCHSTTRICNMKGSTAVPASAEPSPRKCHACSVRRPGNREEGPPSVAVIAGQVIEIM